MRLTNQNYLLILALIALTTVFYGCKKNSNNQDPQTENVTDIDGNLYHAVKINNQIWMVENLKTTKLNDGTPIPNVTDGNTWRSLTTPGFCYYDNNAGLGTTYGALYNWFAVGTGKLAPKGWHVATKNELEALASSLGGNVVVGGKLKEAGTAHWNEPNTGATNETGFTAYGGGYRQIFHTGPPPGTYYIWYSGLASDGYWWTSTSYQGTYAMQYIYFCLFHDEADLEIFEAEDGSYCSLQHGFSVRCVKD